MRTQKIGFGLDKPVWNSLNLIQTLKPGPIFWVLVYAQFRGRGQKEIASPGFLLNFMTFRDFKTARGENK